MFRCFVAKAQFGVDLEELYIKTANNVPEPVTVAVEYIEKKALQANGIFLSLSEGWDGSPQERKVVLSNPLVKQRVNKIIGWKRMLDLGKGRLIAFKENEDYHAVAGLLSLYLRMLPKPVVPTFCYQKFKEVQNQSSLDIDGKLVNFRQIASQIPHTNFETLICILKIIIKLVLPENIKSNGLSLDKIASVFSGLLFRAEKQLLQGSIVLSRESHHTGIEGSQSKQILEFFLLNYSEIFENSNVALFQKIKNENLSLNEDLKKTKREISELEVRLHQHNAIKLKMVMRHWKLNELSKWFNSWRMYIDSLTGSRIIYDRLAMTQSLYEEEHILRLKLEKELKQLKEVVDLERFQSSLSSSVNKTPLENISPMAMKIEEGRKANSFANIVNLRNNDLNLTTPKKSLISSSPKWQ